MSNILYIMENNSGMSNVVNMQRIVDALAAAGNTVYLSNIGSINDDYIPSKVVRTFTPGTANQPYLGNVETLDAQWIVQGMADIGTITQICAFYQTLVSKYRIDAIVADTAPLAQLFAYSKKVPIFTVQSAFAMPPTLPYLRGLFSGATIKASDSQLLKSVINQYLATKDATPINDISDLYSLWGVHITTSYQAMDPFSIVTGTTRSLHYMPPLADPLSSPAVVWRKEHVSNVVIYADHNKRLVSSIITQLLLVDEANIVLISNDALILSQLPMDLRAKVKYLRSPMANLTDYTVSADLVICNANEVTTSEAIKSGIPVMAIPVRFNQTSISNWLVSNHLGAEALNSLEITKALSAVMSDLPTYAANARAYSAAHLTESGDAIAALITAIGRP